jgi:hypothetical protein
MKESISNPRENLNNISSKLYSDFVNVGCKLKFMRENGMATSGDPVLYLITFKTCIVLSTFGKFSA